VPETHGYSAAICNGWLVSGAPRRGPISTMHAAMVALARLIGSVW